MNTVLEFWGALLQPQAAQLPDTAWAQGWLRLGWGLVLAALAVAAASWLGWGRTRVRALAGATLLWCAWPGAASPAFWLGLAFQAPSLSAGLLGLLVLVQACAAAGVWPQRAAHTLAQTRAWALPAALLGWVLLLDTFAVWPLALYPLGFGGVAWLALLALVGASWAWRGGAWRAHAGAGAWALVLWAFALLRLPSGNVWDALLDPWLWGAAHLVLLQQAKVCYKNRSAWRFVFKG